MAHDQNILVKDEGSLYKIIERLEQNADLITKRSEQLERDAAVMREQAQATEALKAQVAKAEAELAEHRAALAQAKEKTTELLVRCDLLDKQQERGSTLYGRGKDYTPVGFHPDMTREQREGLVVFGQYLEDRMRITMGRKPLYGDLVTTRAQNEQATYGLEVVPIPIMDGVQWLRDQYGIARRDCTVVQMTSATMPIPTSITGPTVYWANESAAAASESVAALVSSRPTLTAKKLTAYDVIGIEVSEDATPGFQNFLTERFLEAIGLEEDRVMLAANNSPTGFYGALYASGVGATQLGGATSSGSYSFHNIAYNDIVNTMSVADKRVHSTGKFYFSTYVLDQIRKVKDDNGQPLLAPLAAGAGLTLLGRPFETHSSMPALAESTLTTPFFIYGDFKRGAFFGERRAVEVAFSQEYQFIQGAITMRILERVAFVVALPKAFGVCSTATTG